MRVIETQNLTKVFDAFFKSRKVVALKDLSLSIEQGQIFGLLGPNGAGKTTLIKILLSITFPTKGRAKILGRNVSDYEVRKYVGYLPENHKYPHYLTGEEVLKYFAKLSGYKTENMNNRIDQLLTLVKMEKWGKTKIKKYSKGMMQRLGLAQAIFCDPELIFLDEPTDGVDPIGRKEIRDILLDIKKQGKTIFLNSHLLSEVELITDKIAILHNGELIQEGTVEDLTTTKEVYSISTSEEIEQDFLNRDLAEFNFEIVQRNQYKVKVNDTIKLNELIDKLRVGRYTITSVLPHKNSLEDMFISLINKSEEKNNQ